MRAPPPPPPPASRAARLSVPFALQVAKHLEKQQKEKEQRAMERLHLLLPALGPTVRAIALQVRRVGRGGTRQCVALPQEVLPDEQGRCFAQVATGFAVKRVGS